MLRSRILKLGSMLAAVCAVGLHAGSADATLALNQAAALAVVPILTDDAAPVQWSYGVFTNASSQNVTLHLEFIAGGQDLNGNAVGNNAWDGIDISCPVTGEETVLFVFRPTGVNAAAVDFKCSLAVPTANGVAVLSTPQTVALPFAVGMMTVAVESPAGTTVSSNILFADWLAVDFTNADAYGAEAVTFQGLAALSQDGNRDYKFDGKEYSTFPAQLASNFIAPIQPPTVGATIEAKLILFTLDGTVNGQPVAPGGQVNPVALRGNVYNDREQPQSFNHNFDCFDIVFLRNITPAFLNTGAGGFMSPAGHFDLTPVTTGAGDPAHEFNFGNGDNARKRPAMGWLIQTLTAGAQIPNVVPNAVQQISPAFPAGQGSWARTLGTSVTSFTPLAGDTPTYSSN